MKRISIIVAIYNVSEYLNRCLDSVIKQKGNDIEIILIDDGSTDDSFNICKKYQKKDKRIKIIHQENKGLSAVRNVGYDNSTGEYIWHIDGDDYLEDNATDIIREYLNKYDIICFNYYDNINGKRNKTKDLEQYEDNNKKYILSYRGTWNKVINRKIFKGIRFPEDCEYNDIFVIPVLASKTEKIVFIDEYLYNYVHRKSSLSNKRIFNLKDKLYCLDNVYDKLNEKYLLEVECYYLNDLFLYNMVDQIDNRKKYNYREINRVVKKKFPKYNKNKYWNKSLGKKIYINLIYRDCFFLAKMIVFIKIKIYNKFIKVK